MDRWLLMYTISGILSIVDMNSYDSSGYIYEASTRTSLLGTLFSYMADLLQIMTLAELGNGFLFCLTQARTGLQKAVRYAAIVSCVILSILAIAIFGVYNTIYSHSYVFFNEDLYYAIRKMVAAFNILTLVWALLLLAFAATVFHKMKHNYVLKNVSCAPCQLQHCHGHQFNLTNPNHHYSPQCSSSSPPS